MSLQSIQREGKQIWPPANDAPRRLTGIFHSIIFQVPVLNQQSFCICMLILRNAVWTTLNLLYHMQSFQITCNQCNKCTVISILLLGYAKKSNLQLRFFPEHYLISNAILQFQILSVRCKLKIRVILSTVKLFIQCFYWLYI